MSTCPRPTHLSFLHRMPIVLGTLFVVAIAFSLCERAGIISTGRTKFGDVPEWSKTAIWYQIFPERFFNGDTANDPTLVDLAGSWPHSEPAHWQRAPWTGDWYELLNWEKEDRRGFYYHVQQRRYGGDLEGVIQKLDYLSRLGINAIYFNPLFESPSLHKYDATFYHHIDNNFGPDPEGDRRIWAQEQPADPSTWKWTSADSTFLALVMEAHRRNIKVIIDGVFNHTGMTFWAFRDLEERQEASPYKEWYIVTGWDNPDTPENEFSYQGWNGIKELPEFREDADGIVAGPSEHIHAVVKRWMDPNGDGNPSDGIDGWRLDVAEKVAMPFWRKFRSWVRELNPQAYIVGEVWWQDWSKGIMYDAAPWLQGDAFDGVMNYRWAREAFRFFAGEKTKISSKEFVARLDSIRRDYPLQNTQVLMNLFDSHDTDRMASHIVNRDLPYDKNVGVSDNRAYAVRKPNEDERSTQKLMALFQMTSVGAPLIYYGTEAGMWGADDPDCRKPMVWSELSYAPERSHPFGAPRPLDPNFFDTDLYDYYAAVIHLRRDLDALSLGSFTPLETDRENVLAYLRSAEADTVLVVLNNDRARSRVTLEIGAAWAVVFGDPELEYPEAGKLIVGLNPKSGCVMMRRRP